MFNRRVDPEEVALLLGPGTTEFLDRSGYPKVHLTISDRRLVIAGTNLEELRSGLANVIADLLVDISAEVREARGREQAARDRESASLHERTEAIAALIESIDFRPRQSQ